MILVTGGERSGKSSFALKKAISMGRKKAFIATAEPIDAEMINRIRNHKMERKDLFDTFEEPLRLDVVLKETASYDVRIIECMTTWMGNVLHYGLDIQETSKKFFDSLIGNEIIVTNEVGMGIVPFDPLTRKYVEELGKLNMKLSDRCDEVYFMVSGIPVKIK